MSCSQRTGTCRTRAGPCAQPGRRRCRTWGSCGSLACRFHTATSAPCLLSSALPLPCSLLRLRLRFRRFLLFFLLLSDDLGILERCSIVIGERKHPCARAPVERVHMAHHQQLLIAFQLLGKRLPQVIV